MEIENLEVKEIDLNSQQPGNNGTNNPPNPPDPNKGPEAQTFDENKWITENFGEGITKDVLKERLSAPKVDLDPETLSIAENLKKEPNTKALLNYIAGGGRDIPFFHDLINTDVAALSSFDKVLKQAILTNKDKSLTPQVIESALRSKYNMLENPRESALGREYNDVEKNEGLFKLSQDATAAEEFIVKLQNEARLSEPQKQELKTAETESARLKTWEPEFSKGMGKISIPNKVTVGDLTIDQPFDYELSPEEQQQYSQLFKQTVTNYKGVELNEKNLTALRNYTNQMFAGALMNKLTAMAFSDGAKAGAKALAAKHGGIELGKDFDKKPDGNVQNKVVVQDISVGNGGNNKSNW